MVDREARIALVNRETERMFGYERQELIGRSIEVLIPGRFRGSHPGFRANFVANPQSRAMGAGRDLYGLRKDGTEIPVEIGLNPIRTDEGLFVLASVVDISARKKTEEELHRSNEELERFAYVASHDLQEPLRTVASYVQLLAKRYRDELDADANEFIDFAVAGVSRMQRLIEDLLAFSRVGAGRHAPTLTDADAVLKSVIDDLHASIAESAAVITHDSMPRVLVDASQLEHVFANLIGNALKFCGEETPRVHIGVRLSGRLWEFTVRDNGIGIDPQFFERIFVIFKRLHARDHYDGTGIGLAICKKIVERHGGKIWVESSPGEGSSFRFTLPAVPELG